MLKKLVNKVMLWLFYKLPSASLRMKSADNEYRFIVTKGYSYRIQGGGYDLTFYDYEDLQEYCNNNGIVTIMGQPLECLHGASVQHWHDK